MGFDISVPGFDFTSLITTAPAPAAAPEKAKVKQLIRETGS